MLENTAKTFARLRVQNASVTWMEAYSVVGNFEFDPMSIRKFTAKYPNGTPFCVFLDEFAADSEACIMARNLARLIGAPCVVCNTNTNIANLVGVESASRGAASGTVQEQGWSVVFHRFGKFNREIADKTMELGQPVDALIRLLKARCADASIPEIHACFDELFGTCLDATRPGIAEIVLKGVQKLVFNATDPITLYQILETIFTATKDEIVYRKPGIMDDVAQLAKLGLMIPHAYRQAAPIDDDDALFNYKSFMNEHLYYLLDPTGSNRNCFLTFVPALKSSHLRYFKNGRLHLWSADYTTFKQDELFTIMACLKVSIFRSTFSCLNIHYISKGIQAESLAELSNPRALKRSGNRLEVAASIGITDSSHYDSASGEYSLSGQSSRSFLTNLFRNCLENETIYEEPLPLTIVFDPRLSTWLNRRIQIPFLYGIDLNDSGRIFKLLASLRIDQQLFIRNYERCADEEKIDGFFPFIENGSVRGCLIECKSTVVLNVTILKTALVKALDMNKKIVEHQLPPRLILIFCKQIDPKSSTSNQLHDFCRDQSTRTNLYRVSLNTYRGRLEVLPFLEEWSMFDAPKCHAIIIPCPINSY